VESKYKILFAGGGTGGHIFPAIAVAEKIRENNPETSILFIGTKQKIESQVVPENGFEFKPIWISGFQRKLTVKNLLFPIKLLVSMFQSLFICMKFKPDVAIGTGAYVSFPAIWGASIMGAKIMLLEQNSYPGIANRLLERKAEQIHISFQDSQKYFREKSKLMLTGNPVRVIKKMSKENAQSNMGLSEGRKTLLILGGSLGARSINQCVEKNLNKFKEIDIQIIWQTGKSYYESLKKYNTDKVFVKPFIKDMSAAYASADLILARAGATTIAEIAALGMPVVFVPSPNVAEDHQYKNARSIADSDACAIIKDSELDERLLPIINETIHNDDLLKQFSEGIKKFSKPNAASDIAQEALKLAKKF
jgi:UDP-N-acetylglucosamine--N-acetylmuramyl-(pentapeptide) pyrophosphoryl-undecaprenol N-acetylglucosamine transferase